MRRLDHRNGLWAREIIAQQHEDGTWGNMFHSLAVPDGKHLLTTEQALRRLWRLGFTAEDEPIRRAMDCMTACLRGERKIDDYWEKGHDWTLYTRLMLATWVRIFEPENPEALAVARQWARVIEAAFKPGYYDHAAYLAAYEQVLGSLAKGAREGDFVIFYQMALLQGLLDAKTESLMLDYVLEHPAGMYYIYNKPLDILPECFASREASCYLAAIEVLAGYASAPAKLGFVAEWLETNRLEDGQWDMGVKAKDSVYFPLSDSWRKVDMRKADCTKRVEKLLERLRG